MADWLIDKSELAFLSGLTDERTAILVLGLVDEKRLNLKRWEIGLRAGYSAGRTDDDEKRRSALSAAISRATKRGGTELPHISRLKEQLRHYREHGQAPGMADEKEILERLSAVIRTSSDSAVVSAAKTVLDHHRRGYRQELGAEEVVYQCVVRVGHERVQQALELLDMKNLIAFIPEVDPAEAEAIKLQALNGASADFDDRQQRLEARL